MDTPIPHPKPHCSIGIDVAKDTFQAADSLGKGNISFAYDAAGIKALLEWLAQFSVELIVLEATGGYQRKLVLALTGHKLPVVVANPRQIRDFAKAKNILAKSDRIDASVIADFASTIKPKLRALPDQNQQHLTDLVGRRNQLVSMRTQEQNRLAQKPDKQIAASVERSIRTLNREIGKVETLIEKSLETCPELSFKAAELDKATGVGKTSSIALVATLPEIGTLNRREVVALAGLAPFDFDSGKFKGQRHIWGGRASVRQVLYMVALTAIRFDEQMKRFYQGLLQRHKKKKVALTAVMRKILVKLNAKVRDAVKLQPQKILKPLDA
jgi:transposase